VGTEPHLKTSTGMPTPCRALVCLALGLSSAIPSATLLVADLEAAGAFEHVLEQCATSRRELIIAVTDIRHLRWARNILLNLDSFDHRHTLIIGGSRKACSVLASHGIARPLPCACAYSTHLRKHPGLRAWRISQEHVYLLWWQRWHYASLAVSKLYRVLSLDTDISLRADPYPILWAPPLRRHALVVGLDSEADGTHHFYTWPSANVGFVYCTGASGGAAAWVLGEVSRRAERLLSQPMPNGMAPQMRLWEQDLFRDAVESAVEGKQSERHSRRHLMPNGPAARAASAAAARDVRWQRETFSSSAQQRWLCWLPLRLPSPSVVMGDSDAVLGDSVGTTTVLGDSRLARPSAESLAGLPQWLFSQYIVLPHGNPRWGAWARTPSPVLVGHAVGVRIKYGAAAGARAGAPLPQLPFHSCPSTAARLQPLIASVLPQPCPLPFLSCPSAAPSAAPSTLGRDRAVLGTFY